MFLIDVAWIPIYSTFNLLDNFFQQKIWDITYDTTSTVQRWFFENSKLRFSTRLQSVRHLASLDELNNRVLMEMNELALSPLHMWGNNSNGPHKLLTLKYLQLPDVLFPHYSHIGNYWYLHQCHYALFAKTDTDSGLKPCFAADRVFIHDSAAWVR